MTKRVIYALIFILCGCSIPLDIETRTGQEDIKYKEMVYKRDLMMQELKELKEAEKLKSKIITIRPYKNKKTCIVRAITEEQFFGYCPTKSEATILWDNYKCASKADDEVASFKEYLIKTNPLKKTDKYYLEWTGRIKARTKILKQEVRYVKGR